MKKNWWNVFEPLMYFGPIHLKSDTKCLPHSSTQYKNTNDEEQQITMPLAGWLCSIFQGVKFTTKLQSYCKAANPFQTPYWMLFRLTYFELYSFDQNVLSKLAYMEQQSNLLFEELISVYARESNLWFYYFISWKCSPSDRKIIITHILVSLYWFPISLEIEFHHLANELKGLSRPCAYSHKWHFTPAWAT